MKTGKTFGKIEKEVFNLSLEEQFELLEKLIQRLKEQNQYIKEAEETPDLNEFYGIAKGLWNEDAQEYVNHLREEREWN